MYDPNSKLKTQEKEESEGGRKIPELPCSSLPTAWVEIFSEYSDIWLSSDKIRRTRHLLG